MSEPMIRVAIVDDQPLFSAGLEMLIEAQADMVCVGTATDGNQAIALSRRVKPDIVLMDLRMPVMNGLDATRALLRDASDQDADVESAPRVIVLTTISRDEVVYRALQAGASAFLTKDATPNRVLTTIREAHAGQLVPDASATLGLIHDFTGSTGADPEELLRRLTPREREVCLLIASGLSNAEIADATYLSEATVKTHVRAILHKLDLRSRVQVVVFAYENNLVSA
ncbi:response regulator transcription factor [Diaminobutyricimonas sp. TR449]|uniref:response regulator n=1 Tax=Diaminobutyricimonas sp. TR449 TaxID=2708076 RepID=UPI001AB04BF6|nr:response regulator transcription factor [Diaminobutyricimonas sp. TR449]